MENKHTAVDWLMQQMSLGDRMHLAENGVDFVQAKAMEKEQIKDAHNNGQRIYADITFLNESEKYYNETYNN
jgi:hypothetical protein